MSRRKIYKEDDFDLPGGDVFKRSLQLFQQLVDKTVAQKREERLGMRVKDYEGMDYEKFFDAVVSLFGPDVKAQDVKTFYRKISNNPDMRTEWCEIFGYYMVDGDILAAQLDEENMVFLVSKKQRIAKAGVRRGDVIRCMVKIPQLDFLLTASQKGMLSIFSGQDNCCIIKPMEHCLRSVCAIPHPSELLVKDDILLGDDGGFVTLFTLTSDDFGLKQTKSKKKRYMLIIDSKKFKSIKRKLHDDWVIRVKYIPALNCFGSCSFDSIHSLVLDDLKRIEDNLPVREFSIPRGVNAFTYCVKANIIVTGGEDKILRLWHPNINTKPVGKLIGHLFSITEIVTNEKDQHIISLSTAKGFKDDNQGTVKIWDFGSGQILKILPLGREITVNEHWLMQMVYLKASESKHVILVLEYSGMIKIVQANQGEAYMSITWELPEAVSFALQGYPLIALKLSPNVKKTNGFFPDVQLLLDTDLTNTNAELPPRIEVKCFDLLKVEGYSLLATASANGSIIMWDFETATATHMFRARHAIHSDRPELRKINWLLFLYRDIMSERCTSECSSYFEAQSEDMPTQEADYNVSLLKMNGIKRDSVCTTLSEAKLPDSPSSKGAISNILSFGKHNYHSIPILASAHEDGFIYLWSIMGDLLKEILPYTKHPPIPLTALCADGAAKMLYAANKEGNVIRWNIGSFLEDQKDPNRHVKQQICWRAHSAKIVSLFCDDEKCLVVTASTDGSVRLWHSIRGVYFGYFGQRRVFEITESSDIILPCDVNEIPFTIKEESKFLDKKQKFEYPLFFDREKWKTMTKSSLNLKKPSRHEVDLDFKFFKSLASPKVNKTPLESFKSGNKEAGIVFGAIPIYRVVTPPKLKIASADQDGSFENMAKRSRLIQISTSRLSHPRKGVKTSQTTDARSFPPTALCTTLEIVKQ
ncbi:WD repeat-containing protein 64 [Notechis scutatus]|uniref:WD repeat-containing protein 64 n=1 Tax=Notechis scutatus TaxID=8663 RepID=A0A6J1UBD8_9SAUR|nr:WD repeat-containing protein 64 [Notechis scutatus]